MDLGAKVKARREELGFSQEELAIKMGYKSRSSINKIEKGRPVSQKIIYRLSDILGVSIAYLMGWEESSGEKKQHIEADALSQKKREFIERVKQMPEEELDRLDQILRIVEGTKD